MATMTISLPDRMKEWVEEQVETGDYASSSDYVRDLVRRDRDDKEARLAALRAKIEASFASGRSGRSIADIISEGERIARERGLIND